MISNQVVRLAFSVTAEIREFDRDYVDWLKRHFGKIRAICFPRLVVHQSMAPIDGEGGPDWHIDRVARRQPFPARR